MNLWGKFIPQLYGEVNICGAEGAYESVLECLNGVLRGINSVIARLHKLEGHILWLEVCFNDLCCLVIHDIDLWCVAFADKIFKVLCVRSSLIGLPSTGKLPRKKLHRRSCAQGAERYEASEWTLRIISEAQ